MYTGVDRYDICAIKVVLQIFVFVLSNSVMKLQFFLFIR